MSMNGDAVRQDIAAGKAGVDFHQQWWGWYVGADMIRNYGLNAYFENYEYPSKDGSLVNHRKYYDNSGFFVVNKNYKYPDAVLKLMSYYLYIEAWAVGDGFITQAELDDINLQAGGGNGRGLHIPETWARLVAPIEGSTPQDDYAAVQWAKTHNEDLSKFNSQAAIDAYYQGRSFAKEGNPEGMGEFLQKYHDRGAYAVNINILRDNRWVDIYPKGFTPDEVVAYGSTLTDILKEGFTQIIVGQQPLSYFETLVQEWKASGGDIATQAMNREYKGK
jgi:putative aldouronate transport system substrate-binding protein